MKKMKNRKGFTLVELIVVIAILAILAGVAIPVYSGYIAKAKEATDIQQMDAIKTAVAFALTEDLISTDTTADLQYMEVTTSAITAGKDEASAKALSPAQLKKVAELTGLEEATGTGETATTTFKYTFNSDNTTATWEDAKWTLSK